MVVQEEITEPAYLKKLNSEQYKAVNLTDGYKLVLSAAGTGKTTVLTSSIAHIIHQKKAFPHEILAVTFTNKAAKEMRERLLSMVDINGIWLGTFHSIAVRILRSHGEYIGIKSNFNIIDADEQIKIINQILKEENADKNIKAKIISDIIQRWKDYGKEYDKLSAKDIKSKYDVIASSIYPKYQSILKNSNALDFGDLLLYNLQLFINNYNVLAEYQRRFKYILVDEYQDTNSAQYLWLKLLAQGGKNICCVGDDDQSIYGWRGADVSNILNFEKDFANCTIIRLEQNYRSTEHILAVASSLIANNSKRLGKTLWTEKNGGEKVKLISFWDDKEESNFIAKEILKLKNNFNLSEIAVLMRAGFQTRVFEDSFIAKNIPYKVVGGFRFYDRMEVKDIIAYLRLIIEPSDNLALERIINMPRRNIGDSTLELIKTYAKENNISFLAAIEQLLNSQSAVKIRARTSLAGFLSIINYLQQVANEKDLSNLLETIAEKTGYIKMLKEDNTEESDARIDNIKELVKAAEEYDNVIEFLEHVSLVNDLDERDNVNAVTLMTLHAAKGLEFNVVFLPGWEEGLFPHQRSLDEKKEEGLEEERRLAYVGITRAREKLYISYCLRRKVYATWQDNSYSRFIDELPKGNIEAIEIGNGLSHVKNNIEPKYKEYDYVEEFYSETNTESVIGRKVYHKIFGYGTIKDVKDEDKFGINFNKVGYKVISKYFVDLEE